MKKLIPTFLLLFISSITFSQISGTVVDNNKLPLPAVNIIIKGTSNGSETDIDGKFEINHVSGNQILVISSIGYKTKEIAVTSPTDNLIITLYEGNELLQEVVVTSRNNTFSRKKTAYVAKLPLKDIENANVYSTVTNELLESQITTNIDDALRNATGVNKLWEATGRNTGTGTGFFTSRGFAAQPSFIDGVPGYTFSSIDPSYIERIEAIKGPSATLFGSTVTSLGGFINIVTKKPYEGFGGSINYTGGSFNTHRISVDVNTPLGKKNGPYFRINASYLDQDSFQDAGFRETFFVAPSFSYRVNNRLNLSLGFEYTKTKQSNPTMLFLRRGAPMVSRNIEQLNLDHKKSFTNNDVYLTNPNFNTRFIGDYKLSDQWTSQTIFAGSYSETKGYYSYMIEGGGLAFLQLQQLSQVPFLANDANAIINEANATLQQDVFTRIYDKRDLNATRYNVQQNFIGDFKIGEVRNRMVVGLDYVHYYQDVNNRVGNPTVLNQPNVTNMLNSVNFLLGQFPNPLPVGTPDNIVQQVAQLNGIRDGIQAFSSFPYFDAFINAQGTVVPNSFVPNATYSPNRADLDAVFEQIPIRAIENRSKTLAAYVSDVINITPALTVNVGLRLDHFIQDGNLNTSADDFDATRLSPNAGIVYQPILNKLSVFANYQTGFKNTNPDIDPQTGALITRDPQRAVQFEGGVKTNLLNGKLNLGLSYYNITVNDRLATDPRRPLFPASVSVEEVKSKGFEFEVNANPTNGLNLRASYSYNDSEISNAFNERTYNAVIDELQGRRPEEAGPQSVYNFWADYKFQEGTFMKNFGLGTGFNGASEHIALNNGVSGEFTLPSYTIFNASIYYDAKKIRVGVKANNITDEIYYTGWSTVNPQATRSFLGTITYKF